MNKKFIPVSCAAYPGSKVQFVQRAAKFFRKRRCQTLLEPFAGSGVVGLSLLHAGIIEKLILVEKDERVACILRGLITEADLAERIEQFDCTRKNVQRLLATEHSAIRYLVQSRTAYRCRFGLSQFKDVDELTGITASERILIEGDGVTNAHDLTELLTWLMR
jgi:D12 class N6 adenine-specific DNA methyltransferase